ncbi:MAG: hypothetical protein CXT78_10415 [Thaumarchaeota archaeon]|jgi:DNA-binding transcriptional MerR regulator|nr:MAG: hypothetical protein CXT78_10415 [Nitrososphaerota archaeon]
MPKTVVNVSYSTLEEAEQEVFRLVESGTNYRDIAKIEFIINGTKKKFSISQITKIKKKLSPETNPKSDETKNESEQKAELFKLFQNKDSVVDVIINTKLDSKLVNDSFQEFAKLTSISIIPTKIIGTIKKTLYNLDKEFHALNDRTETDEQLVRRVNDYAEELIESLQQFQYPCSICRESITMDESEWIKTARPAIIQSGWKHGECHT